MDFGEMLQSSLHLLIGVVLDHHIFGELKRPVKSIEEKKPSIGLGLTSVTSIGATVFFASSYVVSKLRGSFQIPSISAFQVTRRQRIPTASDWPPMTVTKKSRSVPSLLTTQSHRKQ